MADDVTLRVTGEVTSALNAVAKLRDDWLNFAASYTKSTKEVAAALNSFSGDRVIREATTYARVVEQIGGVTKLTTNEQRQLNAVVTEAIEKYTRLGREAPKNLVDLKNATQAATTQSSSFFDTLFFKITGGVTAGTILANGLLKAFDMIGDGIAKLGEGFAYLVERGAKVTNITIGFEQLTAGIGQYAGNVLDTARTKTKGLITDFDLMQAANRAMLFGLEMTPEKFGDLGEAAIKLGRAMGMDARKSLDDLVLALGRVSPRILDNLGIIVKVGEANTIWAKENNKTVKEMTAQERVTAFTNLALAKMREHLGNMGELHLTLADRVLVLQNQFTNWTDQLGVAVNKSAVLTRGMEMLMEGIQDAFSGRQQDSIKVIINLIETLAIWLVRIAEHAVTFAITVRKEWSDLVAIGAMLTREVIKTAEGFALSAAMMSKLAAIAQPWNEETQKLAKFNLELHASIKQTREEHDKLIETNRRAAQGQDEFGAKLQLTRDFFRGMADRMEASRGEQLKWAESVVKGKAALDDDTESLKDNEDKRKTLGQRLRELNSDLLKIRPTQENITLVTKEYGNTIEDLTNKAKAAGVAIPAMVEAWEARIRSARLAETLTEIDAKLSKALQNESDKRVKFWFAENASRLLEFAKTSDRLLDAERDFSDKLRLEMLSGVQRRVAEIDVERRKAIEKLGVRPEEAGRLQTEWDNAAQAIVNYYTKIVDNVEYENRRAIADAKQTWGEDLVSIFAEIPEIIQKGLTGGGGWDGIGDAIVAKIGEVLGGRVIEGALSGIFNKTSGWLVDTFGTNVTGALGKAIPSISAAAGSLVATGIDTVLTKLESSTNRAASTIGTAGKWAMIGGSIVPGWGHAIGAAAGAIVGFIRSAGQGREAIEKFAESAGGFEKLRNDMLLLGEAGEQLWVKMTQKTGKNDLKGAEAVIKEIQEAMAKAAAETTVFNDQLTLMLGSVQGWGQTLPAAAQGMIDQLIKMGRLTKENAAALMNLGSEGSYNFEQLKGLAEKYGVSLDALGPKFRAAEMSKTASEIIHDFELMLSNGADFNMLLDGMADEISKVAQHSVKFGTEIPGNMRPWIEELMKSGKLLDENGKQITDINKLTFGDDIKVGLQAIVDKLQEMIDLLAGPNKGVSGAIGEVGRRVSKNVDEWGDWSRRVKDHILEVREEVDGVSLGSSPGGLKEIPLKLMDSARAVAIFSRAALTEFGKVRRTVDEIGMIGMGDLAGMEVGRPVLPGGAVGGGLGGVTLGPVIIDAKGAIFYQEETFDRLARDIGQKLTEEFFRRQQLATQAGGR